MVKLDENPTTGYIWQSIPEDFSSSSIGKVLKFRNESFISRSPEEIEKNGVGGTKVLEYHVTGSGAGNLILYNARTWELEIKMMNGEELSSLRGKVIPVFSAPPGTSYSQIIRASLLCIVSLSLFVF